jgi:hypothetical protein
MAYVELYNNTGTSISVDIHGTLSDIPPSQKTRLKFGGQFLVISSSLGQWRYDRAIIPYGGEDGPYFDGTIYAQINEDGHIYALKKSESPPLSSFTEQPEGFPIEPGS